MNFDLSNVLNIAKEETNILSKYKIVYPSSGKLTLRLLYNPDSDQCCRLIYRHNLLLGKYYKKVPCLKSYDRDCPICKVVDTIEKELKIDDIWKLKPQLRGISFAQYVGSSSYDWNGYKEPEVGEVVLFMYPYKVYQKINNLLIDPKIDANDLLLNYSGSTIEVNNSNNNYDISVGDKFLSSKDQEEFNKLITSLGSLNDQIISSEVTPDIDKIVRETSESLSRKYLEEYIRNQTNSPAMSLDKFV